MESSLPVSELELETRSVISVRAETNPGPFSWLLDYGRETSALTARGPRPVELRCPSEGQ